MDCDLYLALGEDDVNVLKGKDWLLVRNQLTPANNTVLHLACQLKSVKCVKEILQRADESLLLQMNSRGETALHLAARQGNCAVVEAVTNKAKSTVPRPNNPENRASTVLQNLIRATNLELETALHVAVRYNNENVVKLLVKEDPSYAYPQNKYRETPLYLAAVRCYAGVTKVILDNCESPTFGGPDGRTALHAALMSADGYECMRLLLEKNEDLPKVADNNGWTAFHFAAHNNLWASIKDLVNADKPVAYYADKKYKRTAIHIASYKGHTVVLSELLKYLPDAWESVDGNSQNILHIAVKQKQKIVISFILSKDMKTTLFSQRDIDGSTPLHLIAKLGYYTEELQNAGNWNADWDMVNDTNFTPKDMFHEKQTGSLIDQALVGITLDRTQVQHTWDYWIKGELPVPEPEPDTEDKDYDEERKKELKEMVNTHMIVAALITTVALTAGFAMPGGFDGNEGPNQGSAILLRKPAFKTFMVADTIALLFSICSLFFYFLAPLNDRTGVIEDLVYTSVILNVVSIIAVMVAFIAGTSAVLSHSLGLTISVCVISSLFILLVFYVCFKFFVDFSKDESDSDV
ncbi:protein ACCELERATED CELL DEATH 6-like [Apium graveolens]|uniref:protein ACCELERATED CELL DEATH 6-like n=1 Tax=Apium graveolens TaxID=4045 RepID=UPI003D7A5BFE